MKYICFFTCSFIFLSVILSNVYAQVDDQVNLSLNRPVTVSSTDHSPTPGEFAVDGEDDTGWRAIPGAFPQWVCVDLQAECSISGIELFCEADSKTPLTDLSSYFVRGGTFGNEIFSSYATSYKVEISLNDITWREIYTNKNSLGDRERIDFNGIQQARFVRIFIDKSSNKFPVGVNEMKVLGSCKSERPVTRGWTERRKPKGKVNPELKLNTKGVLPIENGWELTRQGWNNAFNGSEISKAGLNTKEWYNATVPGTIVTTLVDQEVFPDPAIGLNNLKIPESLCRHNWWYRRSFILPPDFNTAKGRNVFLELDGINHHANIWVNGQQVGTIPSAFLRGVYDITKLLNKSGENVLAIEICPMSTPGVPGDKGEDGNVWVQSGNLTLEGATFNCSSGWDWMPAMRDRGIGILGDIWLKSSGAVVIDYPLISSDLSLPDTTKADLSVEVPVKNVSGEIKNVAVTVQFEKIKVSKQVILQAGESKTVLFKPAEFSQLHLKKPKLWWPNGYGNQYLYQMNILAQVNNELSDSFETQFGIRKITYNTDSLTKERRGQSTFKLTNARYVRINCTESLNGYFALFDLCVYNSSDLSTDLAAFKQISASSQSEGGVAKNANDQFAVSKWISANGSDQSIVVDLGKTYPIDRVIAGWDYHGLATKYNIETSIDSVNWQTVAGCTQKTTPQLVLSVNGVRIFCRGGNWGLFDLALRIPEEKMKEALLFHKELGFTMIRNWMGNTMIPDFFKYCDLYGLLVMNDFWASHPKDEKAYIEVAKENIKRFRNHPSLTLWCGSNESYPPPLIDEGLKKAVRELDLGKLYVSHSADDQVAGFGPYFYTDPKNYFSMARGFKTEIGLASMPVYETTRKMTGYNPVWPINDSWYYHDYPAKSKMMSDYLNAMETRLGKVSGAEDYCKKAQFVNYENLRAIFEAWNHKLWDDCSAVLLWMTHPAWYSTVWQLYDYDYEVGGAWAGTKKGSEVYHIQATLTDWKVDALNYSSKPLKNISISSKIYNVDGIQIGKTQTAKVDISASDKTKVFDIAFPSDADSLCFVKLEMRNAIGQLLSDNFYWKYQTPENMRKLNTIPSTTIEGKLDITKENDQTVVTLRLKNVGKSMGVMLVLSLVDEGTSERILPTHYSDNYFWMLPEEEKVIKMKYASGKGDAKKPIVRVTGYNLKDTIVK